MGHDLDRARIFLDLDEVIGSEREILMACFYHDVDDTQAFIWSSGSVPVTGLDGPQPMLTQLISPGSEAILRAHAVRHETTRWEYCGASRSYLAT
jgi:hypothetical protein